MTEIDEKIEEALYYMQNDTLKAIEIFDEILEIQPENIDAINGKGSSLMKLNRVNEAEKYFDYSLSICENSSALINKGLICKANNNYEKSLYYYDKAIHLNPDLNNIITLLKNEILELIDNEEMELSYFNENANDLIKKAMNYKKSNYLWDALYFYKKAMEIDPTCSNSVKAQINEIKLILRNELLIKTPTPSSSKINKLKIESLKALLIEEDPEQSLAILNRILENNETDIDTLNQKGVVLFSFDECLQSIECFDRCLEIDENYYYALFNKGFVLRRMNKLNESLNCFDELLKTPELHNKVKPYQLEILDKLHQKNIFEKS